MTVYVHKLHDGRWPIGTWIAEGGGKVAFGDSLHEAFWNLIARLKR